MPAAIKLFLMNDHSVPGGLVPVCAAALVLLAASAFFSGCYTLKQGSAMLGYLGRAVPLESLSGAGVAGPGGAAGNGEAAGAVSEAEKNRLFVELVLDIRRFAMEELGLKESKNYTKYVELDRDYLAAVVSASAKDSFTRYEWHFPVVGAVPYKGFFNVEDARKERAKLEKKDLDVWVRGVDAFSTLGWFQDPLYSYMRDYSPGRLADLIVHELVHATVFIKGHVQFNEELAEFIGGEGARLYMEKRFGLESGEYRTMLDAEADSAAFLAFIRDLIAALDVLYQNGGSREEILRQKEETIRAAQEKFEAEYETRFLGDNYRGFSKLPVNNAYLELYRLYYDGSTFYRNLYERSGGDLVKFIAAAKTLPLDRKDKSDPKRRLEKALEGR
jgi:predicted aminopeptidase